MKRSKISFEHFGRAARRPIDLVDDHNLRQARAQSLAEHEARLRQRAFGRVDQQHDAVDHRQRALDLAAEIGVPGVSTMLIRRSW
jgi:epoxyqueuosine reductase QueG